MIQQLSRRPQGLLIAGSIVAFSAIAYIPISEFCYSVGVHMISYNITLTCFYANGPLYSITDLRTVIREARQGLPFTLSPEYLAAQRAYMRYHNMNPIFGISSR